MKNVMLTDEDATIYRQYLCKLKNFKIKDPSNLLNVVIGFLEKISDLYECSEFDLTEIKKFDDKKFVNAPRAYERLSYYVIIHSKKNRNFNGTDTIIFNNISNTIESLSCFYNTQLPRLSDAIKSKNYSDSDKYYFKRRKLFYLSSLIQLVIIQRNDIELIKLFYEYLAVYETYSDSLTDLETEPEGIKRIVEELSISIQDRIGKTNDPNAFSVHAFIANNLLLKCIIDAVRYAQDEEPCLIIGETGTGKELIANIMHKFSPRKNNNYAVRNLANMPDTMFDSEICGMIKGYATGILKERIGIIEHDFYQISKPGTLFLDELNSLPEHLQAKLLRIIETKCYIKLGEFQLRPYFAKVICACNNNRNDIRPDLFFRFKQIIELPTLREISEDIPKLLDYFIDKIKNELEIKNAIIVDEYSKTKLIKYPWPGNIREFRNVIYRIIHKLKYYNKTKINFDDIKSYLINDKEDEQQIDKNKIRALYLEKKTRKEILADIKSYFYYKHNGNVKKASKDLQCSPSFFQDLKKEHKLKS